MLGLTHIDEISRRDGYENIGLANKLYKELSNDLKDFDTLANGEWGSLEGHTSNECSIQRRFSNI